MINHRESQEYELDHAVNWIKENVPQIYDNVADRRLQKNVICDEFFTNRKDWGNFVNWIENKNCLEIGSGPAGAIIRWWWTKHRTIIDPLIEKYKQISLDMHEKTWFDKIEIRAINAEELAPDLRDTIDGAIVCRNCLDHCKDPWQILTNIGEYASINSYLLLWTDLYHLDGHDKGHCNITKDLDNFVKTICDLGFKIEYEFSIPDRSTINYGCRAKKVALNKVN